MEDSRPFRRPRTFLNLPCLITFLCGLLAGAITGMCFMPDPGDVTIIFEGMQQDAEESPVTPAEETPDEPSQDESESVSALDAPDRLLARTSSFPPRLREAAIRSTVRITNVTKQSNGTGAIVGRAAGRTYILTADHVVRPAWDLRIECWPFEGELLEDIDVVMRRRDTDLALLAVTCPDPPPCRLLIAPPGFAPQGSFPALSIGCTDGQAPTWQATIARGALQREDGETAQWFTRLEAKPGRSGGPLVDERGYLIGVCSSRIPDEGGLYAHSRDVHRLIDEAEVPWLSRNVPEPRIVDGGRLYRVPQNMLRDYLIARGSTCRFALRLPDKAEAEPTVVRFAGPLRFPSAPDTGYQEAAPVYVMDKIMQYYDPEKLRPFGFVVVIIAFFIGCIRGKLGDWMTLGASLGALFPFAIGLLFFAVAILYVLGLLFFRLLPFLLSLALLIGITWCLYRWYPRILSFCLWVLPKVRSAYQRYRQRKAEREQLRDDAVRVRVSEAPMHLKREEIAALKRRKRKQQSRSRVVDPSDL